MEQDFFTGKLVRLCAAEAQVQSANFVHWSRDSEYARLQDSAPARRVSVKAAQSWFEKNIEQSPEAMHYFAIRTLVDDRLIGDISLDGVDYIHGDTFVGIGIGERTDWGRGYGTDAMRIMLRYAFLELNLQRVSLNFFEYNARGQRSYEKAGFKVEGRARQFVHRDGQRYNLVFMGILRAEWAQLAER
jgi:RimJ/RimL family protein N-acetyltransferase